MNINQLKNYVDLFMINVISKHIYLGKKICTLNPKLVYIMKTRCVDVCIDDRLIQFDTVDVLNEF